MSVELDPAELGFKRPFTHEVSQVLRLHNPTNEPIAFKVKTTAPKQYCVRPNSGRIEPSSTVEIQVLLQTMKEDPPLDVRCKDKFLVQSVTIPANTPDGQTVSQIWAGIESTAKSSIQEKKIRVVFLPADGQPQAQANGIAASSLDNSHYSEDQPPAYSSPSPQAVTPQRAVGPANTFDDKPEGAKNRADAINSAHNPAQTSALSSAAAAVTSSIPMSQEDLRRQLDDAKATISRLQEQAGAGLRQRNVGGSGEKSSSAPQGGLAAKSGSASGVPVQIVALLCLLCFLIAYFFF
ncbi:hypothetical protein Q7P37_009090 [Cladosporium fusiforme]